MLADLARDGGDTTAVLARQGRALRCIVALGKVAREPEARKAALSGLTYLAKDMLDRQGLAPGCGLADTPANAPTRTATILSRLDGAGACCLGFAEMTALACEPSGGNPGRQRPLNPWNPLRICGGSSSGSAVAVAAGLVDFAIGSDTAGSLRIPAHCCGVTAWKPTPGVVPSDGAMALAPSLDVLGFLARDARTLERIAAVFMPAGRNMSVRRIAFAGDLAAPAENDIASACTSLAQALTRRGLDVAPEPLAPLLAACDAAVLDLLQAETSAEHGWRLERGGLDAMLEARLRKGLTIGRERADEARLELADVADTLLPELFDRHDAILLPVMPGTTPEVAACEPGSPSFSGRTLYRLSAYTRFVNGLRLPTVALPCGFDGNGMPVAAQLVGPPGSDLDLLALAVELQAITDWHGRAPAGLPAIMEAAR